MNRRQEFFNRGQVYRLSRLQRRNQTVLGEQYIRVRQSRARSLIKSYVLQKRSLKETVHLVHREIRNNLVICQIYMESRFDANAVLGKHSARGLMQMQMPAVKKPINTERKKTIGTFSEQ